MGQRSLPYPLLIVPGLGGSGPGHWQSHWTERFSDATRVTQLDWDRPELALWLHQLRKQVEQTPNAVLVGHSLGCILIAHLMRHDPSADIAGALLVAPAHVDSSIELPVSGFRPIPRQKLPFPSALIASTNDTYITLADAVELADAWGSRFYNLGACGHINIDAGFGPWPDGERILEELCRTITAEKKPSSPQQVSASNVA